MRHISLRVALAALAATATLLAGCSGGLAQPRTLTSKDSGSSVQLAIGETLAVSLEGNPTTGYTWEVGEVDQNVLKQIGDMTYQADSNAIGAGGVMTFHFQAVATGQTRLKLIYHRPFETDVPPIQTFDATLMVVGK